ncbi:19507_t:CDS:2 [Gigaspora rosea]|nr:19507_t:CDS:2 [Gigaspora rosea]
MAILVRGAGSNPSETHLKAELWLRIFSTAFKLHKLKFLSVWELQHLISGSKRNIFAHWSGERHENLVWQEKSTLFYIYDDEILSFNFHEKSMETKVEMVLRLVTYLRETVSALPILPGEAVHFRTFEIKFTPPSKRVKYNVFWRSDQMSTHQVNLI